MTRTALPTLIAVLACAREPARPLTEEAVTGTWVLEAVNDAPLPWIRTYGEGSSVPYRLTLRAQSLALHAAPAGSCRWVTSLRWESLNPSYPFVDDRTAAADDDCVWSLSDGAVYVGTANGPSYDFAGPVTGSTLTLKNADAGAEESFQYRRR